MMGRKGNRNRSSTKKPNATPKETNVLIDKESAITEMAPVEQDCTTVSVKPFGDEKIRNEYENSAADLVSMVVGIIGGTMTGGLFCPIGLVLMGPVGGVIISAGVAGLSGVAIQEALSKHVQRKEMLLSCFGCLALPVLIHLFTSGRERHNYNVKKAAPRSFVH